MTWTDGVIYITNDISIDGGYLGVFASILLVLFIIAFVLFVGLVVYFAADTIKELEGQLKE